MATDSLTPLERRLLEALRAHGEMHGRLLASELEADSGAVARCLVHLESLGLLQSETMGRTKRYQVLSDAPSGVQAVVKGVEEFDDPRPVMVLPVPGSSDQQWLVVVLPGVWVPLHAWLALRRVARRFALPVELLIYSEREARRLARLPGNPVRAAVKEYPERGARLMEPRW